MAEDHSLHRHGQLHSVDGTVVGWTMIITILSAWLWRAIDRFARRWIDPHLD